MGGCDPCLDRYATTYYNRPDVQKALHVSDGQNLRKWSICNMEIFYSWSDSKESVLPIYKKLIDAGLRLWVYRLVVGSGNTRGLHSQHSEELDTRFPYLNQASHLPSFLAFFAGSPHLSNAKSAAIIVC
ncbi:hypothetical protein Vadar_032170 [Vaccinium darrowii]|uniref:Uncharacterized protein n=1 Tax=Vaccinium darrowii TaxID=229202 RepID=A0ACB7YZX2_9ERIC|nr:hypothetical protein Vadar_032170 [Vaccinium darrowii]